MKADLRGEDWSYQFLLAYNREVLANANRAIDALEGNAPLADEALLVAAYRATQYRNRNRRGSTYEELISTGAIGLIHEPVLRDTAIRLYNLATFDNLVNEGLNSRYRAAFRMLVPNDVQRALAKNCGDHVARPGDFTAIQGNLDYPCSTGLSLREVAQVHAWRGETEEAFAWLDKALALHDGGMMMIKYDPFLVSLRADPRYAGLVRTMGLPE